MKAPTRHPALVLGLLCVVGACHVFVGLDEVDPVRDGSAAGQGGLSAGGALSQGGAGGAGGIATVAAGGSGGVGSACGNGVLDTGEECDDGNLLDGDGCSADCAFDAAAQCPPTSQISLQPGVSIMLNGTTFAAGDEFASSCDPSQQSVLDVAYRIQPSVGGALRATLEAPFTKSLYIRETCDGVDIGCGYAVDNEGVTAEAPVVANNSYFIFVEGNVEAPSTVFQLTLTLDICGDGIRNPYEECDDGNTVAGDGCSESCMVECASGFKRPEDHHCYQQFTVNRNWDDALSDCISLGPGWNLAAISSAAERNFIDDVVNPSSAAWLGGNDIITEGTFVWINGEPFSFDNWLNGEPNNAGGFEDCVEHVEVSGLSNDRFNDEECSDAQDYICELTPAGS